MPTKQPTTEQLIDLARAAAAEAANYQERFAAADTEARKIVDIMERFLRITGRVVYGGAAINAHLPADKKFYDPTLYLPDYDFMTPDPLQDCADLIAAFRAEGFDDVEAKFGIHEGTYKVFVNFRAAADITYMPPQIYARVITDAHMIEGIHYASPNFIRMNMYLELSRPAGMVSRWEKVYGRLLLLNEAHPLRPGHCTKNPIATTASTSSAVSTTSALIAAGIDAEAIFLSGIAHLIDKEPDPEEVILLVHPHPNSVVSALQKVSPTLQPIRFPALGELLPARTELQTPASKLVAVVFETVACHNYTTLASPKGYRMASLDFLLQMYYAMYFADLQNYVAVRLLCVIQQLIEMEAERRTTAVIRGVPAHDVFPLECLGHQPTMPELKKAHRDRVREKRAELQGALRLERLSSVVKPSPRKTRRQRPRKSPRSRK
jgi:hypothetical protein